MHRRAKTLDRSASYTRFDLPLAVAAVGVHARCVLRAYPGVRNTLDDPNVDVILADTPNDVDDATRPTVLLSDNPHLAVPAFDSGVHNPIGWRRTVGHRVAALGPLDRLPSGVEAHHVVHIDDLDLIRRCHHLEDVANYHANTIERAGTLVRLAATGAPVHAADVDPQLEQLLGRELSTLLTRKIRRSDSGTRELHSIRTRRLALRDHSIHSRLREIGRNGLYPSPLFLPSISILLATNRPAFLNDAIDNVRKQNYPRLELILALHGDNFDHNAVEDAIAPLPPSVEVVRVGADRPFPVVLNAATAAASGDLVTKMDDDDLYDEHHVWDLALAHEYSGADLIGKGAEFVYLQRRNQTIERNRNHAETYSQYVAGGTFLIARDHLDAIGGWQGMPPHVDRTLIHNVVRSGGLVYRTHGYGYMLVRHGEHHSWTAADESFLTGAHAVHDGWQPRIAGFEPGTSLLRESYGSHPQFRQ